MAAHESHLPGPARLRVVSYNVFQARYLRPEPAGPAAGQAPATGPAGGAAHREPARSLLRDFTTLPSLRSADVVLLQEALAAQPGAASQLDTVGALARALGVEPAPGSGPGDSRHTSFHPSVRRGAAHWGLGIVSRVPARFTPVRLPNAWWSPWPRTALVAEIGPWILVTLHLEVWPVGAPARNRQAQAAVDALADLPGHSTRPTVVAGDFNCQGGGPHHILRRHGFDPAPVPAATWSLGPLALRLDHVYVRNAHIVASGVEAAARGSDHRPLWADLEYRPPGARRT